MLRPAQVLLALTASFSVLLHAQPETGDTDTATAIIEVITEPELDGDTLRFEGDPSGLLTLEPGQPDRLSADNLPAGGTYASSLVEMGPLLSAQGYGLDRIVCDDDDSTGDVASRTANFSLDAAETVVCQFRLAASSCACPRAGRWRASNLPGSMVCTGPVSMTIPLPANSQRGTLQVADGCQSLVGTNFSDEYADVVVSRGPGCSFEGAAQGTPLVISFVFNVESEEFINGSLNSEFSQQGATCTMSRDFELSFED